MEFRIADTFTRSLARLTRDEQKAVKTTAFDLQVNPASPGLQFHKLDRARDKNFWSVRVSADIRVIVHRTAASVLLCYAGHHDDAYAWAERRKLEVHPTTGAAQLVEIREAVREMASSAVAPLRKEAPRKRALFREQTDDALLGFGVPQEWLAEVKTVDEDGLLSLADHLPAEAAEALLELATGGVPRPAPARPTSADPFAHPDAQRRFRIMESSEELAQALEYPWDQWTIFLHPSQREVVERDWNGPARVSGSAGTGKTIVALHRAVFLARRYPDARVLLATFSEPLARALHVRLRRLVGSDPRLADRLEVHSLDAIALRLYRANGGREAIADAGVIGELLQETAASQPGMKHSPQFLLAEWTHVVDAWQLDSWDAYRDVARLGRRTRLPESQRRSLWTLFEALRVRLRERNLVTRAEALTRLAGQIATSDRTPFQFIVLDEAQDVDIPQLRLLAAMGGRRPNALFFAGDLGQRIFQQPFSWTALGVDVRGRSRTLRVNYRTSHQIRRHADRLLPSEIRDTDGNAEDRRGTVSVFNGPEPVVRVFESRDAEIEAVASWLGRLVAGGMPPHEIGLFVRAEEQLERAIAALQKSGIPFRTLDERLESMSGSASLCTMHLAKGLEFRAVIVMACDDEVLPLQSRIEAVGDPGDLEEVYDTERHLLYVACTRAREHLLVTAVGPASEFLADLAG